MDGDITMLLREVEEDRPGARDRLVAIVYRELHAMATNRLGHADRRLMEPTTLVHETYMRLFGKDGKSWENRRHFFFVAAKVMRDVLVDRARRMSAQKRGGRRPHGPLTDDAISVEGEAFELLSLHDALDALEQAHPVPAKVVMLRFFAGLDRDQTGEIMGISAGAAWREWMFAKGWLLNRMNGRELRDESEIRPES